MGDDEEGLNDDSGWVETLVDGDDEDGVSSAVSPTRGAMPVAMHKAQQQASPYPPWFNNVPGHTPKELADMIWNKTMPMPLQQLLRQRQMEFLAEQQHAQQMAKQVYEQQRQQHQQQQQQAQPPVPTQLLQSLSHKQEQRDQELFDRHHHTNLVYWKRNFKYMTAEEIDNLLSQQRSMLKHSTYAEDYYYQVSTGKAYPHQAPPKSMPPLMGIHRPICMEPLDHPARPEGDMFVGVLGKIPFASLKSPKPIVVLEDAPCGQLKATSSRAIRTLENNVPSRNALLHVIEDGLLLALHLSDLTDTIAQLPHSERAPFAAKQQQVIASLVYILNVFVLRRPQGSYFPSLFHVNKGCKFLRRCLLCLPREQKTALLLVCLSAVGTIPEQPDDALIETLRCECLFLPVENAVAGLVALSQAFASLQAFQSWASTKTGSILLGSLLQCVRNGIDGGLRVPNEWPAVFHGFFESVLAVLPRVLDRAKEDDADPGWNLLLQIAALSSPAHQPHLTLSLKDVVNIKSKNALALQKALKV